MTPGPNRTALLLLASSGFPLSGLGFVATYRIAYGGTDAGGTAPGAHELFWLSVALALATTAATFVLATNRRRAGAVLVVVFATLMSLPKLLRSPYFFNFFDEQAHVRAVRALLGGARLFDENPLNRVVADYPGLHAVSATLASATGGSVFVTGNLVILAARIAGCLAVFLLAERVVQAPGAALAAAVLFVANPAFAFFDAQFAYESLASPLVAVTVLLAVRLGDEAGRARWVTAATAAATTALVVLTHHGSSYVLAGLLAALALGRLVTRRAPDAPLLALAGFAVVAVTGWLFAAAGYTLTYVGPYVKSNLTSVPDFLGGRTGPRALFGGFLPVPGYERVAGFLAVLILLGLFGRGIVALRAQRRRPDLWLLAALGTVYFLSLPLVALRGDQVVKRLWEFAFIGLAPVCAVALVLVLRLRRGLPVTALLMLVVFVGSGVARSGEHIRFPGPYVPSADPRSMTPDVVAAARWMLATYGPDHRISGDRTLAVTFGATGMQTPVTYEEDGYPVWLIFTPDQVTPQVLTEIRRAGVEWIAVDLRAVDRFPLTGFYFNDAEPGAYVDTDLTRAALSKFDRGPFERRYDNGNVVLYRVVR